MYRIPNMENPDQQALDAFLQSAPDREIPLETHQNYIDFLSDAEEQLMTKPEKLALPTYQEVEMIQNNIEFMRSQKTPADVARHELGWIMQPFADFKAPANDVAFEKRILNIERSIGGKMLPKSRDIKAHYFWFDHNGEWFYDVRYADKPDEPNVIHYVITPEVMTKTSNSGHVVAFQPGEPEALFYRIRQYYEQIQQEFYGKMPTRSDYDLAA